MSITVLQDLLGRDLKISVSSWLSDEQMRGEQVQLFREYAEGAPRANLTAEMRKMLRINDTGSLNEFNDNVCPVILNTMIDRIKLAGMKADNEAATEWAEKLLKKNRLDALQLDVHEAAVRDGNTFLLIDADTKTREVRFVHEPAFNGTYGMAVLYESTFAKSPLVAVKLWQITSQTIADTMRVNLYYADRIERYIGGTGSTLAPYNDDGYGVTGWVTPAGVQLGDRPVLPWTVNMQRGGEPLGVPVFHFRNRGASFSQYGLSEIEDAIPLQDALNRTLYSMVATAELTAFPIRALIGAPMPAGLTPGMYLNPVPRDANGNTSTSIDETTLNWLNAIRLDQFQQGEIVPYIDQAKWLKSEMYANSSTPTDDAGDNASGESLKQREVKLLGKVARFETRNGNAWEDAITFAARVQTTFGSEKPPVFEQFDAQWGDAELRDDAATAQTLLGEYNAGLIDQKTYLEAVAEQRGWDEQKIQEIIDATEKAKNATANQINANDVQAVHDKLAALDATGANGNGAMMASANGNGAAA